MDETAWNQVVEQHIEMNEYLAETMAQSSRRIIGNQTPGRAASATSAKEARSAGFGS
jgi:hypothetical protein